MNKHSVFQSYLPIIWFWTQTFFANLGNRDEYDHGNAFPIQRTTVTNQQTWVNQHLQYLMWLTWIQHEHGAICWWKYPQTKFKWCLRLPGRWYKLLSLSMLTDSSLSVYCHFREGCLLSGLYLIHQHTNDWLINIRWNGPASHSVCVLQRMSYKWKACQQCPDPDKLVRIKRSNPAWFVPK